MEVVVTARDEVVIVEPRGRINSTTSRAFGDRLIGLIRDGASRVIVDLSQVLYISSAGFRVLLIAAQDAADRQCSLALCSLSNEIRHLFEISAFVDEFRIYVSREEAVASPA